MRGESDDPELPTLVGKFVESVAAFMPPEVAPLVPYAGYVTEALVRRGQQQWLRWQRSLEVAAEDAARSVEELVSALEDTPAQQELLSRVLEASGRAIDPAKVAALGLVLSRGLQEDRVDEALILAAALDVIEAPHVQVLLFLQGRSQWLRTRLDRELESYGLVLPGLLAVLGQHGLAESGSVSQMSIDIMGAEALDVQTWETHWWITPLGKECLALLTAVSPSKES